ILLLGSNNASVLYLARRARIIAFMLVLCIGGAQRYGKNCLMDTQRMTLIEQNGKKRGENRCPRAIISLTLR
ncbi:MAG: hypothetical protein MR534_03465, partial [Prevotellaceae bacterium]|nr:hypothetical protein [Prevotellaceae bacterium]